MDGQRNVEAFPVERIKGRDVLDATSPLPFSREVLARLLGNCPVVMELPATTVIPKDITEPETHSFDLWQVSTMHKRSFEVSSRELPTKWQDEYGNTYRGISLKGNNFSKPGIMEHPTAPDGLIAYGLQESNIIGRTMAASQVLRARGIATENLLGLTELKYYPWPSENPDTDSPTLLPLGEYKNRIIKQYWLDLADEDRTSDALVDLYSKFKEMAFYVSLRATDSPYRLLDLEQRTIRGMVLGEYFTAAQLEDEAGINPNTIEALDVYLIDHWVPRAAANYAKLHVDMAHRFAHGYNMTVNGGIVDLDSIHGEGLGLGDDPITHKDRAIDITTILSALSTLQGPIRRMTDREAAVQTTFVKEYLAKTTELHAGDNTADYIGELIVAISEEIGILTESNMERQVINRMCSYYCDDVLKLKIDKLATAEAVVNMASIVTMDKGYLETYSQIFEASLPGYIHEAIDGYINEINAIEDIGQEYDIYDVLMSSKEQSPSTSHTEMYRQAGEFLALAVADMLASSDQAVIPGLGEVSSVDAKAMVWDSIVRQHATVMRPALLIFMNTMLTRNHEKIASQAKYQVPPKLLKDAESYLYTGVQNGRFWRSTEGVTQPEAAEYVAASTEEVRYEKLNHRHSREAVIRLSSPDNFLLEVIGNGAQDGYETTTAENIRSLTIGYTGNPEYILVVEQKPDGGQLLRMQVAETIAKKTD